MRYAIEHNSLEFFIRDHPDLESRLRKEIAKIIRPGITSKEEITSRLLKDIYLVRDIPHLLNSKWIMIEEIKTNPNIYSTQIIRTSVKQLQGWFWRENSTHTIETVLQRGNSKIVYDLLEKYPGLPLKWIQNFTRLSKDQVYAACGLLLGFNKIFYLDRNGAVACVILSHNGNKGMEKRDLSKTGLSKLCFIYPLIKPFFQVNH